MSQLLSRTLKENIGGNSTCTGRYYGDAMKDGPLQKNVPAGKEGAVSKMEIATLIQPFLPPEMERFQFHFENGGPKDKNDGHNNNPAKPNDNLIQNNKPTEINNKCSHGNYKPNKIHSNVTETNQKPSKGDDKPAMANKRTEGNDKPAEIDSKRDEGSDNPMKIIKPAEGNDKPAMVNKRPEGDDKPAKIDNKPAEGNNTEGNKRTESKDKADVINDMPDQEINKPRLDALYPPAGWSKRVPKAALILGPARRPEATRESPKKRGPTGLDAIQPPMKQARVGKTHWPVKYFENPRIENGTAVFDAVWLKTPVCVQDITGPEAIEQCKKLFAKKYGVRKWDEIFGAKRNKSKLGSGKGRRV